MRDITKQITAYQRLANLIEFFGNWEIVLLDEKAVEVFQALRRRRVRIGTQDLKIAAIALANDALLLSANTRDFLTVPGLSVENWLL